jgi:hypothetical protein
MKYTKPSLTFSEQADQLLSRGMVTADRETLITHLGNVSYYRLSAYWYPFREPDERLKPETSFEEDLGPRGSGVLPRGGAFHRGPCRVECHTHRKGLLIASFKVSVMVKMFQITRQAALKEIGKLVELGIVRLVGQKRGARYILT